MTRASFLVLILTLGLASSLKYECYTRYYYQRVCHWFSFSGECQKWSLQQCKPVRTTRHEHKCPRFFCDLVQEEWTETTPVTSTTTVRSVPGVTVTTSTPSTTVLSVTPVATLQVPSVAPTVTSSTRLRSVTSALFASVQTTSAPQALVTSATVKTRLLSSTPVPLFTSSQFKLPRKKKSFVIPVSATSPRPLQTTSWFASASTTTSKTTVSSFPSASNSNPGVQALTPHWQRTTTPSRSLTTSWSTTTFQSTTSSPPTRSVSSKTSTRNFFLAEGSGLESEKGSGPSSIGLREAFSVGTPNASNPPSALPEAATTLPKLASSFPTLASSPVSSPTLASSSQTLASSTSSPSSSTRSTALRSTARTRQSSVQTIRSSSSSTAIAQTTSIVTSSTTIRPSSSSSTTTSTDFEKASFVLTKLLRGNLMTMAAERDCGDRTCTMDYRFMANCVLHVSDPDSNEKCDFPCSLSHCQTELHHYLLCPVWSCTSKTTTTTSPSDMSTLEPLPMQPSLCSNEICIPSLVFNFLLGLILSVALAIFFIRRRKALSRDPEQGIENPLFDDRRGPIIRHSERLPLLASRQDSNPPPLNSRTNPRPPALIPNFYGQPANSIPPPLEFHETTF